MLAWIRVRRMTEQRDDKSDTDRNYMDDVVKGITYEGNRVMAAWYMARGSYAYTASFIGRTDPSQGEPVFTHWDALKGALETFWDHLWRKQ